jgi:hypothetical protein
MQTLKTFQMSWVNHVAGGVVFTGIYLSMADVNIFSSAAFLFFTAFFLCSRILITPALVSANHSIQYRDTWN